jgi:hypothetical protein
MKKRQHFVPQFYLRRFASLVPREEIWTYDATLGTVRSSTVENTGFERYLYSPKLKGGSRIDDLEDFMSKIENRAASLYDRLLGGASIIGQDRADLASFFALMFVRTDSFRRQYAKMSVNQTQFKLQTIAAHDGAFANFFSRLQVDRGAISDEEKDKMRDAMNRFDKFTVTISKDWSLRALRFHDTLAPLLFDMRWVIMRANPPDYFITGDNPFVKALPDRYRNRFVGEGFANRRIEVTVPLSSNRCLLAHWQKEPLGTFDLSRHDVKATNRLRAIFAERFLFCHKYDAGVERLAAKYRTTRPSVQLGFGADEYSEVELRRT